MTTVAAHPPAPQTRSRSASSVLGAGRVDQQQPNSIIAMTTDSTPQTSASWRGRAKQSPPRCRRRTSGLTTTATTRRRRGGETEAATKTTTESLYLVSDLISRSPTRTFPEHQLAARAHQQQTTCRQQQRVPANGHVTRLQGCRLSSSPSRLVSQRGCGGEFELISGGANDTTTSVAARGVMRSRTRSLPHQRTTSSSFWDRSLQTRSIAVPAVYSQPARHCGSNRCVLPRIGSRPRTVNGEATGENHRYPRGQQRPVALASGRHELLSRHRELVFAAAAHQKQLQQRRLVATPTTCGLQQERVESLLKARAKCQEWLNNAWIED